MGLCLSQLVSSETFGFWATGHHVIAVLAFELLEPAEQQELLRLLRTHPRFQIDFTVPESIQSDPSSVDRWHVGKAGEWSDIIRRNEEWDRPTWHYQLGATMAIGGAEFPEDPNDVPDNASLETKELHVVQAVKMCRKILSDRSQSDEDRAIAICWLAHLVADSHQSCHAGSLYSKEAFPEGDRGANSISVKNGRNLHAVWDSTLGKDLSPGDVRRRVANLMNDQAMMLAGQVASDEEDELMPERWVVESRNAAKRYVYTDEALAGVMPVERGLVDEVQEITLSDAYLERAGRVAQMRASQAAHRLAAIWRLALDESTE